MKKFLYTIISFIVLFSLSGCAASENNQPVTKTQFILNTVASISVYNGNEEDINEAFSLCTKYENMLSRTIEGSDIYKINNARGKGVKVNPVTCELIKSAKSYGDLSDGLFDISIGIITDKWEFSENSGKIPIKSNIEAALPLVDYKKIKIDETNKENPIITVPDGAMLDLGGIAKGYIADCAAEYLSGCSLSGAVINLGGNVVVLGSKPDGSAWGVGLRDPNGNAGDVMGAVSLNGGTVVTSGSYERRFKQDGIIYHHILNPKTGYPYNSDLIAATVCGNTSADADALSTVCFLLGRDKALKLIESIPDTEAVLIGTDNTVSVTSGLKNGSVPFELLEKSYIINK